MGRLPPHPSPPTQRLEVAKGFLSWAGGHARPVAARMREGSTTAGKALGQGVMVGGEHGTTASQEATPMTRTLYRDQVRCLEQASRASGSSPSAVRWVQGFLLLAV